MILPPRLFEGRGRCVCVGMMAAAPAAASAAAPAAVEEENGLLDVFKKPKYIFLFIGDGMGTVQVPVCPFL